jgi:ketosteroid isomerase-like protein
MTTGRSNNTDNADLASIREVANEFLNAYNSADLGRLCMLLTEGAVLMPPNEPRMSGIEAIRARFEGFFSGFTFNMKFDVQQTDLAGDIAFERGTYAAFALLKGTALPPRGGYGKYLLLFERQSEGIWKIAAFGTAAAQGVPPQSIAGPERLADLIGDSDDPGKTYWRDKWLDTLSELYPSELPRKIREKLD